MAQEPEKEQFKTLTLFEIDNFLRDVARCPLKKPKYKDLQVGDVIMCHEAQNWTDPAMLGTVNWADDESVKLGDHALKDMENGNLFVKPGNLGRRNNKFNTLSKMKSIFCSHVFCMCFTHLFYPPTTVCLLAESEGWWEDKEVRVLPVKGQFFGEWFVESVATNVGIPGLWDNADYSKNWSCTLLKKPKTKKQKTQNKDVGKRYVAPACLFSNNLFDFILFDFSVAKASKGDKKRKRDTGLYLAILNSNLNSITTTSTIYISRYASR